MLNNQSMHLGFTGDHKLIGDWITKGAKCNYVPKPWDVCIWESLTPHTNNGHTNAKSRQYNN